MTAAGTGDAIVAPPADVTDPEAAAAVLAEVFGGDAAAYLDQLPSDRGPRVHRRGAHRRRADALDDAITDGRLTGHRRSSPSASSPWRAPTGVMFVGPCRQRHSTVPLEGGATSVALVSGIDEGTQVYATSADADGAPEVAIIYVDRRRRRGRPDPVDDVPAAGRRASGSCTTRRPSSSRSWATGQDGSGTTIYVVEPHGRAVFADHQLPFEPVGVGARPQRRTSRPRAAAHPRVQRRGRAAAVDVGTTTSRGACPA